MIKNRFRTQADRKTQAGEFVSNMHERIRYNSPYSEYVSDVREAHGRDLLKLALSGSVIKRLNKSVPPLSEADAKDCVQAVFSYFLSGIEERSPSVMKHVLNNPPESRAILYMLIPILQYRAIDIHRSHEKKNVIEEEFASNMELAWDLHQPPKNPEDMLLDEERSPLFRLTEILEQAVLAGQLKDQEQRAFRWLLRETVGEVSEQEAASELGVSVKRYQNLKSEAKKALRNFSVSRRDCGHV